MKQVTLVRGQFESIQVVLYQESQRWFLTNLGYFSRDEWQIA